MMYTDWAVQGHRDGYHHDRTPERRQDVPPEGSGGEARHPMSVRYPS